MAAVDNTDSTVKDHSAKEAKAEAQAIKAAEKALQLAKEQEIYNNFATPLIGTFLNLPKEPVLIKCPSCGINELSEVLNELKWWASEVNRFVGCLFVTLCCCCCFDYFIPCKQTDRNHYCKNCGCYFGRAMKYAPIQLKSIKK